MADICMCANGAEVCKRASTCYRVLATPDTYQTVADFYKEDEECQHYWETDNNDDNDNNS